MLIDYSTEGAQFTGAAKGLGVVASERQRKKEARQYEEQKRAMNQQLKLEAEMRARAWEIEKMELRSRMDFEREEQRRQKRLAERDARLQALEDATKKGQISQQEYEAAYLQEMTNVPFYTQYKIAERAGQRQRGGMSQLIEQFMNKDVPEVDIPENAIITGGKVSVRDPDGKIWLIDPDKVPLALQRGGTIVTQETAPQTRIPSELERLKDVATFGPLRRILTETGGFADIMSPAGTEYLKQKKEERIRKSPFYYFLKPGEAPGFKIRR